MTNTRRTRGRGSFVIAIVLLGATVAGAWWFVRVYLAGDTVTGANPDEREIVSREVAPAPPTRTPLLTPEPPLTSPSEERATERATLPSAAVSAPEEAFVSQQQSPPVLPPNPTDQSRDDPRAPSVPSAPTAPVAPISPPAPPAPLATTSGELAQALTILTTNPIESRRALTRLLDSTALSDAERRRAYEAINEVSQPLFFQSGIVQGDDVFASYRVEEGDTPPGITRKLSAQCESDLLLRVNAISDPRRIRIGQVLKVPKGPFHAEVRKGEYRINLFHGEGPARVMIASYPVGLGEFNTTPTGIFNVRPRSKLKDPQWRNPRTGEFFAGNDPKNPIGERWIGLEGIEPHNRDFAGYGIHGTIEPESIGQMRSMGCIRMRAADVEIVYEMLTAPNSTIVIAP